MKEEYINKINELLNQSDVPLLDFIYKLLKKRVNKPMKNCLTSEQHH